MCHAATAVAQRHGGGLRGAVKKFGWAYKPDPVGTRCSASVLGLPSRTRSSASLPFNFFTASGDAPRPVIQAFRIEEEPLRPETFDWRFPQGPVAPPRRWLRDRRPCAIARPSSAEEGNQNVQSPESRRFCRLCIFRETTPQQPNLPARSKETPGNRSPPGSGYSADRNEARRFAHHNR